MFAYTVAIENCVFLLLPLPSFLPPSQYPSVEQCSFFFFFRPTVFLLFSPTASHASCFLSSLSFPNFTMCYTRAAAVCYCAACRQAAWSPPVISSHCPCAVTCTREHGVWEDGGTKREVEGQGKKGKGAVSEGGTEKARKGLRTVWRPSTGPVRKINLNRTEGRAVIICFLTLHNYKVVRDWICLYLKHFLYVKQDSTLFLYNRDL